MKYDSLTKIGLKWAGYIDVKKAYDWDPTTLSPKIPIEKVLGVEAPLWTETVTNSDELEYLAFLESLESRKLIGAKWNNESGKTTVQD